MTFTGPFLFRALRFGPLVFVVLFTIADNAGLFGEPGQALFVWIVLFPLVLLSIVGVNRAVGGRRRTPVSKHVVKSPPKPSFLNVTCLLYGGLYGLLAVVALIVFAGLTQAHPNLWQKLVFAAVILSGPAAAVYFFIIRPRLRYGQGYIRGQQLICKAKYAQARDVMLQNAAERPQDATAWNGAAWVHQIWWEELEALACAHRAVQLSRDADSYLMRGQALARLGASEEALADFMESDRVRPTVQTNTAIGAVLTDQRRLTPALQYLEGAAGGANVLGTAYLADAYRLAGHAALARQTYRDVAADGQMCGKAGLSFSAYGHAYFGEGEKVKRIADEALTRNPHEMLALQGLLFAVRNDLDDAYRTAAGMALVSAGATVRALSQPEFAHFFAERRFRELFVACVRVRNQNIAAARRIIAATGA